MRLRCLHEDAHKEKGPSESTTMNWNVSPKTKNHSACPEERKANPFWDEKPKDLFSKKELPKNSNNNPFKYTTWEEIPTLTTEQPVDADGDGNQDVDENGELVFESITVTGEKDYFIKIEDIDLDSPSYGKSFTYSI